MEKSQMGWVRGVVIDQHLTLREGRISMQEIQIYF